MPRSPPSPAPALLSPPRRYGDRSRRGGSLAPSFPVSVPDFVPPEGAVLPPDTVLLPPGPTHSSGEESRAGTIRSHSTRLHSCPPLLSRRACRLRALGLAPAASSHARSGQRRSPHASCPVPFSGATARGLRAQGPAPERAAASSQRLFKANKRCNVSPSARLPAPGAAAGETAAGSLPRCLPPAFGKYSKKNNTAPQVDFGKSQPGWEGEVVRWPCLIKHR